jgi:hypothetical protein
MKIFIFILLFLNLYCNEFDSKKEILNYKVDNKTFIYNNNLKLITRIFTQDNERFGLTIDLQTYETEIVNLKNLDFNNSFKFTETDFYQLLKIFNKFSGIANSGMTKSIIKNDTNVYLTIDMCPSSKKGFEKEFFEKLIKNNKNPVEVAIAISGKWIEKHQDGFFWLLEQQKNRKLNITWINHTYNHRYKKSKKIYENFLLLKGTNLDEEILKLEKTLLKHNQIPSIFIRFPGLIADEKILNEMREKYSLLPIGSDTWIAKGEKIVNGSIILIHGNLNEHKGIVMLNIYLEKRRYKFGNLVKMLEIYRK